MATVLQDPPLVPVGALNNQGWSKCRIGMFIPPPAMFEEASSDICRPATPRAARLQTHVTSACGTTLHSQYTPEPSTALDSKGYGLSEVQKNEIGNRVTFSTCPVTVYEVTPYSEVYGIHPSCFDFDKKHYPNAWCFVGDASDDSDSDEDSSRLMEPSLRKGESAALTNMPNGVHTSFTLPGTVKPGCLFQVNIFGVDLALRMPEGVVGGQVMRCSLVDGTFNALLQSTMTSMIPIAEWELALTVMEPTLAGC